MTVLGKRKASGPCESLDAATVFRQHFESRFQPLPAPTRPAAQDDEAHGRDEGSNSQESGSEWGGFSDTEEDAETGASAVEIVDHSASQTPQIATMTKRELKAFMSSRPPDPTTAPETASTAPTAPATSSSLPEDAPSLLAQDLELRRLLAESHLLAPRSSSLNSTAAVATATQPRAFTDGRIRQKTTDMRIQALGSSVSLLKQDKMPMQMRKGLTAAANAREAKRRREARESGIILEKEVRKTTMRKRIRERPVDRPGVGRLKGAELRLTERDIKGIEGSRDVFGRRSRS